MTPPLPNPREDAQHIFTVLKSGGIALCPTDLGYALMSTSSLALEKIFMTKQRAAQKRHPMMGSYVLHKELHILPPERAEIVRVLTQNLKVPLAVVAKYDPEHRVIKKVDEDGLEASTADGTIVLMMGTGAVSEEVTKLCEAEGLVLQGSSANPSGTGEW
jgi:tRNA A37 threonylcarbamoyladenosine synthetase subunit TsaC/SUA5/YrdC